MKSLLNYVAVIGFSAGLISCSKKEAVVDSAAPAPEPAVTETTSAPESAAAASEQPAKQLQTQLSADLAAVPQALEKQDYESAVDTLMKAKYAGGEMSHAQTMQYQQQLLTTTRALIKAKDKDPRAARAWQILSRTANGR